MKRSGNSGVVSYIWGHFDKNDIIGLHNTNLSLQPSRSLKVGKKYNIFHTQMKKCGGAPVCFLNSSEHMPPVEIGILLKKKYCYFSEKRKMAIEYDCKYFSKRQYNILLVRSPHNHLASILKHPTMGNYLFKGSKAYEGFFDLWIKYAREALDITNFVPSKIVILFDKFVSSEEYRKKISESMEMEHNDSGINTIARRVGSSFNGKTYRNDAQKMDISGRWKYLLDPGEEVEWDVDEVRSGILNPEIVAYTRLLFDVDLEKLFHVG